LVVLVCVVVPVIVVVDDKDLMVLVCVCVVVPVIVVVEDKDLVVVAVLAPGL